MPSVQTPRIHDLPPPKLKRMRLEFFRDIPEYGISFELGTIKAYVSHFDAGDAHPFMGFYYVDDRSVDSVTGTFRGDLPAPNRGGRKPKIERDIAVFLAVKYFEASGKTVKASHEVRDLWLARRKSSVVAQAKAAAVSLEPLEETHPEAMEFKLLKAKQTHEGIKTAPNVFHAVGRAKKHLADTILGVIGGSFSSEKEGSIMILLLRGSGFDRTAKDADRAVLRGPFWAWVFGEEEAEYFSEKESFEVTLDSPIHPGWYVAKNGQLTTDFKS